MCQKLKRKLLKIELEKLAIIKKIKYRQLKKKITYINLKIVI